jgi:hypothetical protein
LESADSVLTAEASGAATRHEVAGSGSWLERIARAGRFAAADPDAVVLALSGFLLRGGIVVLAIPSVVLPSLIGLASVFGVNALGIDGRPTPWLISIVALGLAGAGLWLVAAVVVGSIVDVWLVRAALGGDARLVRRPQPLPGLGLLLDMAAIRVACLLPVGAAIAAVSQPIYSTAYDELTLPTNLADPLLVRVATRAAVPLAIVAVTWLITEMFAAIAVRRLFLGAGVVGALTGTLGQIVRRPLQSLFTLIATSAVSFAALAVTTIATALAFLLCLDAARASSPVSVAVFLFVASAVVLAFAWVVALAVAGIASAWRSAAWTEETASAWSRRAAASPWYVAPRQNADPGPVVPVEGPKPHW